eukprot:362860-Chlamydomonas_euryale.AAC.18
MLCKYAVQARRQREHCCGTSTPSARACTWWPPGRRHYYRIPAGVASVAHAAALRTHDLAG